LKTSQKKALLRTLIDKVILQRVATDKARLRVVWRGGLTTTAEVRVTVGSVAQLSDLKEITETICRLASQGQTDEQIAAALATNGHRAPHGGEFKVAAIAKIRRANRIFRSPKHSQPFSKTGYLTIPQVAEKLKEPSSKIYYYVRCGKITAKQDKSVRCFLLPDKLSTLTQIRKLLDGEIERLAF
jgi:hypothetical protein